MLRAELPNFPGKMSNSSGCDVPHSELHAKRAELPHAGMPYTSRKRNLPRPVLHADWAKLPNQCWRSELHGCRPPLPNRE